MKSPTPKPKLIVKLARSLSYKKGRKDGRERVCHRTGRRNMSSAFSLTRLTLALLGQISGQISGQITGHRCMSHVELACGAMVVMNWIVLEGSEVRGHDAKDETL